MVNIGLGFLPPNERSGFLIEVEQHHDMCGMDATRLMLASAFSKSPSARRRVHDQPRSTSGHRSSRRWSKCCGEGGSCRRDGD